MSRPSLVSVRWRSHTYSTTQALACAARGCGCGAQTATAHEIGKAYKRKCLEWHPDKHGQDEESQTKAREMFNAIGEAQEILSDEKRRAWYDEGCDKEVRGSSRACPACWVIYRHVCSPEALARALRDSIGMETIRLSWVSVARHRVLACSSRRLMPSLSCSHHQSQPALTVTTVGRWRR
jgi:hypothetical protein